MSKYEVHHLEMRSINAVNNIVSKALLSNQNWLGISSGKVNLIALTGISIEAEILEKSCVCFDLKNAFLHLYSPVIKRED